ncbi:MAG: Mrp/NBP35 family ATP-binding protein, partial [Desulfurococcales archaeon]|nr:Mrp/NBP35 family ATP-binding protein [Desulfurococcales archaeon]
YIFGKGGTEELAKEFDIELLGSIPLDPRIREANDKGRVFFMENPDAEASKKFLEITDKIINIVEKGKARIPRVEI